MSKSIRIFRLGAGRLHEIIFAQFNRAGACVAYQPIGKERGSAYRSAEECDYRDGEKQPGNAKNVNTYPDKNLSTMPP
jgi:hypothetical protein